MLTKFFDKLEDKLRRKLSHHPIVYGLIGGVGVVLFWRGVWHTADYLMLRYANSESGASSTDLLTAVWWDGPLSLIVGSFFLLMTGLFVSNFIGNEIIISGLKGEKKLSEKTEKQVKTESRAIGQIKKEVKKIFDKLDKRSIRKGK